MGRYIRTTKPIDTAIIKERIAAKHGNAIRVISKFKDWRVSMRYKCTACKHTWESRPQNVIGGTGCPICAKDRRAVGIKEGHAKSNLRYNKMLDRLEATEDKFNITLVGPLPTKHSDRCKFKCNSCSHVWAQDLLNTGKTKYGCPACGRVEGIKASNTPELVERRRVLAITTTSIAKSKILKESLGRTILVSKWNGASSPRKLKCNVCEKEWLVRSSRDGIKTGILCPDCPKRNGFSFIAVRWLDEEAEIRGIRIQHAKNGGEYKIPGTNLRVDGYHAESKTVFEFHGDAFHGNPKVFKPHTRSHPFKNIRARTLHRRTIEREEQILDLGYDLVVMWEYDYKRIVHARLQKLANGV